MPTDGLVDDRGPSQSRPCHQLEGNQSLECDSCPCRLPANQLGPIFGTICRALEHLSYIDQKSAETIENPTHTITDDESFDEEADNPIIKKKSKQDYSEKKRSAIDGKVVATESAPNVPGFTETIDRILLPASLAFMSWPRLKGSLLAS